MSTLFSMDVHVVDVVVRVRVMRGCLVLTVDQLEQESGKG